MIDHRGRVWLTAAVRPPDNPEFCREGSDHPSARAFPYDARRSPPGDVRSRDRILTHVSTCFSTHHLMFAEDENHTLWTSGGGQVVGWLTRGVR
jgi:hypothetical protein